MSLKSLYSGFKFLDDNLVKPTKTFFKGADQTQSQLSARTKDNSFAESPSQSCFKGDDAFDKDIWDEGLDNHDEIKASKHKKSVTGRIGASFSTATPFIKPKHGHTKSLITMVGDEGIDSISLHDGSLHAVQSTEAPLLFAKGGYDQHVKIPKNLKQTVTRKSTMSSKHKGGFIIVEDELEDPLESQGIKVPQLPFHNLSGITRDLQYDVNDEVSNFLSGKLDFNRASKPLKSQPAKFIMSDTYDPLDSARSSQTSKTNKNKLDGDHRRNNSTLAATNAKDSVLGERNLSLNKTRSTFSPFSGDTLISTALTWERAASHGKNADSSNFDDSEVQSKHDDSVIIREDETSELDLSIEENGTEEGFILGENKNDNEPEPHCVRTKLIEEFKALKSHQLCMKGIYIIPSQDPLVWSSLIFVKGGYYEKGKFKFQIQIPTEYPVESIRVYSLTKVYHPLINVETGEVDLKLCEQNTENRIEHVLLFIKSIFNESKYLEKVNSFNPEAGSKFTQNPYYFKIKAKESVKRTESNNLNEKENIHILAQSRIDVVRKLVKTATISSSDFDIRVQNLLESVTKNLAQTR